MSTVAGCELHVSTTVTKQKNHRQPGYASQTPLREAVSSWAVSGLTRTKTKTSHFYGFFKALLQICYSI